MMKKAVWLLTLDVNLIRSEIKKEIMALGMLSERPYEKEKQKPYSSWAQVHYF